MKTKHITLLAIAAAAFASCAPNPSGNPGSTSTVPGEEVPAPQVEGPKNLPVGRATPDNKPNMVMSPFRPYNVIDVTGYRSGDIVGDPSTARVDPATGKPNLNTSKHFRIP